MKFPMLLNTIVFLLLLISFGTTCHGALQYGFYRGKCGTKDVEAIIAGVVRQRFFTDSKIVAALLRMQFHDCFVNGCDASILLDGPFSEKTAPPNLSVFGYDLIDRAKAAVEAACPGVVSCADIIIAATRDAIALAGGLSYQVPMGRRDGTISLASRVNLPSPSITVRQSIQVFQSKGLNTYDMVLLLGGHTVGVTHCSIIRDRLYNFRGTGKPDPSLNPIYVQILSNMVCPRFSNFNNFVFLDDPSSALKVDNSFYKQLLQNKGILPIDQALASDWSTRWIVQQLAGNSNLFLTRFNQAMVKLASVQVLTGTQGQIRRNCRRIN
ncbi:peroxidase 57-like [Typha angustifolia]|uniref:peroxidase 57-like n=1 Tax=Typha angustifolia TaxID=59011 RepID=UPI003C2B8B9C